MHTREIGHITLPSREVVPTELVEMGMATVAG